MKQGWEVKKLSDVGKVYNGNSINEKVKKDKYLNLDSGLPYIATKDVTYDSVIEYNNGVKIPFEEKNKFKIAPSNTVLICAEGGSAGRKIGITNQEACFGNKLFAFSSNKNIEGRFVYYYFFSSIFQMQFAGEMAGIIGGVSMNKFKEISISFPQLPEQQRIVAILDEAFEAIANAKANAEQNLKNAKELFESYLQSVFENKGEDSQKKKLVEVCDLITCGVAATPKYVDESEGIPFLSAQNVRDGEVVLDKYRHISKIFHQELTKKNKPAKGDVLYSRVGSKFGEAGVVEHEFEFSVYVSLTLIKPMPSMLNSYYLKHYLNSSFIKSLAMKSISSSGVPNLNVKNVREFPIKLPSMPKQEKIIKQIELLSLETKRLETIYKKKIEDLEELKKSILQKAFNGEL